MKLWLVVKELIKVWYMKQIRFSSSWLSRDPLCDSANRLISYQVIVTIKMIIH